MKPRGKVGKGRADGLAQPHELMSEVRTRRQTVGRPDFQTGPQNEQIRDVRNEVFLDLIVLHEPPPLPVLSFWAFLWQADPPPV